MTAELCPNGHLYTPETTTSVVSHGRAHRRCRRCHRAADRAYRARLRAVADQGAMWRAGWAAGRRYSSDYRAGVRISDYRAGVRIGYRWGWDDHRKGYAFRPPGAATAPVQDS